MPVRALTYLVTSLSVPEPTASSMSSWLVMAASTEPRAYSLGTRGVSVWNTRL